MNSEKAYVGQCYGFFLGGYTGFNDRFVNNSCIFTRIYNSDCKTLEEFEVGYNYVYSKEGTLRVCGQDFYSWQERGHDTNTKLGKWPKSPELLAMIQGLLEFS
jgi:hypothetical protein